MSDEPSDLATLARALETTFDVVTEDSLVEALLLLEGDGDFAVVIANASLPNLEGLNFFQNVKAVSPTTTLLAMTESAGDASACRDTAVFRFITKPSPADVLRRIVSDAVSYHTLVATGPAQPVEVTARPISITAGLAPVVFHEQAPSVAWATAKSTVRVGLQLLDRTVELLPGTTIIGRSRTCHIPLADPKISRRHACFSNTGQELSVRNISATNGLRVNGALIEADCNHRLMVGDRITIGSHHVEVCALGDYNPSLEPTHRVFLPPEAASGTPSGTATLTTLAKVANKYFLLGQNREAERILRPLLEGLLRHCDAGQTPLDTDLELAVGLTLRIAESSHAGEWLDYLFDLFSALGQPMEGDVVDRLYQLIPGISGARIASFRGYLDTLKKGLDRFGPGDRFLLRRIQGLETPLMMSAHV